MPSAFTTIGVPLVDSEEDYEAWARRAAGEGQALSLAKGEYRVLTSNAGPQLWAGVDRRGRVAALTPHYAGAAVCRARLTSRITRAGESRFEGAFDGWALSESPTSPADASGDTVPLLFDAPDYLAHLELRLPALVDVQIAAFAFECTWHRDPEAFDAAQATAELPLAEQAFAYLDVFQEDPQRAATAMLSARVAETALQVNELSGCDFRWASARTLIGDIDIVADPAIVDGEPTAGGLVDGAFWLSGRITTVHAHDQNTARARPRLWQRRR
jgi:hypothetical protein